MKSIFEQLLFKQQGIFDINVDKGFWPKDRNTGEAVMLIISELGEMVEGHRKNKLCSTKDANLGIISFEEWAAATKSHGTEEEYTAIWARTFEKRVKDTIEDEMADTVIRLLDVTYGFGYPLLPRDYRKETTGNFAHDVLRICWYIQLAFEGRDRDHTEQQLWDSVHPGKDWGYALAAIIKFCEWYNIDIIQHVNWKIKYNATKRKASWKEVLVLP